MSALLTIDGAQGEGGGQILRSSLSLSLVTGRPVHVHSVRAGRRKPGLMRQHLTCLRAAAAISGAQVQGAELRSPEFRFAPGPIRGGEYHFQVGSAGSVSLVLQTLLPALLHADGPSVVTVEGGTHVSFAPTWPFLVGSYLPALQRMGAQVDMTLLATGFNPAGGGCVRMEITPSPLRPLVLEDRGDLSIDEVTVVRSGVPRRVAERELSALCKGVGWDARDGRDLEVESPGPGNAMWIRCSDGSHSTVFDAVGTKGRRAEHIVRDLHRRMRRWQLQQVPVEEYLADQLLLPLALAGGGTFRTTTLSLHARTNMEVIARFLPVDFLVEEGDGKARVEIRAR